MKLYQNQNFKRRSIYDFFQGNRIVVAARSAEVTNILEEVNRPFNIPIYLTDIRSAEIIKYASNAFLTTKISFINEIANICERVGDVVEQVALGKRLDKQIGLDKLWVMLNKLKMLLVVYGRNCFELKEISDPIEYHSVGRFELCPTNQKVPLMGGIDAERNF